MSDRLPGVLISSTFYDLMQIRADLADFIGLELGYRPLISEAPSFRIDPDVNAIENCRRRVAEDADILVLMVGSRYGSIDPDTSKSITNIEYLAARAKGIPIFAFVEKRTLTLLEVWEKAGPLALGGIVDDVRLFEFVQQVRSIDKVWVSGFETAQEVVKALRMQFAYLVTDALLMRWRLARSRLSDELNNLSGVAFRMALEKPQAWEGRLFAQVLADEIANCAVLRREQRLGIVLGSGESVALRDVFEWMAVRSGELARMVSTVSALVNVHLAPAIKPPGDVASIIFAARSIGAAYRTAIDWAQRVQRANVPDVCSGLFRELAALADVIFNPIDRLTTDCVRQIAAALVEPASETPIIVVIEVKFDVPDTERLNVEAQRVRDEIERRKRSGEWS